MFDVTANDVRHIALRMAWSEGYFCNLSTNLLSLMCKNYHLNHSWNQQKHRILQPCVNISVLFVSSFFCVRDKEPLARYSYNSNLFSFGQSLSTKCNENGRVIFWLNNDRQPRLHKLTTFYIYPFLQIASSTYTNS